VSQYSFERTAFHKAARHAEARIRTAKVEALVENAKEKGIASLYKHARVASDIASTNLPSFLSYCKDLFISPCMPVLKQIYNPESHELLVPITEDEVDAAIAAQKSKAPSTIGLSPADLKCIKGHLISPLTTIYNWCLRSARFPSSWLESSMCFLYKNKGNRDDPGNFRSINVQNPFLKCYNKILMTRLSEFTERNGLLPDEQHGFRANRSCFGAVSLLHEIVTGRLKASKRTYVAYIDLAKAFDKVDRTLLFEKLLNMSIPLKACAFLFNSVVFGITTY